MRAIIVDDERLARVELRRLLSAHPEIEIAAEAKSAKEAEEKIATLRPDLLFLDVQMPARTGFDLLQTLRDPPRVIFTTAYDRFALRAFEFGAVDYLLKPIEPARLAQALTRVRASDNAQASPSAAEAKPVTESDQVFLRDGERCWLVRVGEIRLLEAEGNYARVYVGDSRPLIPRTLQELEARLDPKLFMRVSRQHIVNLRFIRAIDTWVDGGFALRLNDADPQIKVSRRRAQLLRDSLSL